MADGVSVVVPHYGDPQPTEVLIQALRHQVGDVPMQIVVSDDASPKPFPAGDGYEVVRRDRNGGFGSAVNTGAGVARYDLLLILNSDVEIGESFIRDLVEGARPWLPAVVSTRVVQPEYDLMVGRKWPRTTHQLVEALDPLARFHGTDTLNRLIGNDVVAARTNGPAIVDWAVGVCLLLPLEDFRSVGGFDEAFFMNAEEIDLQRRLHGERGLPVVVLDQPVIHHQGGGSSDPARRAAWLIDSRTKYHTKWLRPAPLRFGLRAVYVVNLAWATARRMGGRPVTPWRIFREQNARLDHAWRTR